MAEVGRGTIICARTAGSSSIAAKRRFAGTAREREAGGRSSTCRIRRSTAMLPSRSNQRWRRNSCARVYWPEAASVTSPLGGHQGLCGAFRGARRTHAGRATRARWRASDHHGEVATDDGAIDARETAVLALGPWTPDVLDPLGLKLPLAVKRGYHLHFRPRGNAGLTRPVVDAELGYCVAPMEQGLRLTTGAEFAPRDAPPTPVQFDRLLPAARALYPLGEAIEDKPWMGSRPCFADSRPVHRPCAGTSRAMAGVRPCALGAHARPGDRTAAGGD